MTLEAQSRELYDYLCSELKQFSPGKRFYSVRQLITKYKVSQRVVNSALDMLENKDAINRVDRQGIFVKQSHVSRKIALLLPDWPSDGNKNFSSKLRDEFAKFGGLYEFFLVQYDYQDDIVQKIQDTVADFIVLFWPGRNMEKDEIARLAYNPTPVVMWSDLAHISMHSISGCSEFGAMLAASYFMKKGHKKLALLPSEPLNYDIKKRIASFANSVELFGDAEIVWIDCVVKSGDYSLSRAYDAMLEHLDKHGANFTGVFVMSDESSQGAMTAITESGYRIPEDISVIGYGSSRQASYYSPPLTTLSGEHDAAARELVRSIHELIENPHCKKIIDIQVKPEIVERASVKDLTINP